MTKHLEPQTTQSGSATPSLVPLPVVIGLAILTTLLLIISFVMVFVTGMHLGISPTDIWSETLPSMLLLVPLHLLGIPIAFVLGSWTMNRFNHAHIQRRNAIALGFLISGVFLLWRMGINA